MGEKISPAEAESRTRMPKGIEPARPAKALALGFLNLLETAASESEASLTRYDRGALRRHGD